MAPGDPTAPIDIDSLPPEINHRVPDMPGHLMSPELLGLPLREAREVFERAYLKAQVDRFGGSVSRAANFVQMERSALHRKLRLLHVLGDDEDVETPAERDVA
jgi:two-component system nitrogen regulation response regulator NtrX